MDSAFGIDHGEISKASYSARAGFSGVGSKLGKLKKIPGKIGNAKVSINDVGRGVGQGVKAVGGAATKSPTITGLAVLGGGGYAGYRAMQKENLPKRRRQ